MDALKEIFNIHYFKNLAAQIKTVYPALNDKAFVKEARQKLDPLSLNERMRLAAHLLHHYLPANYKQTITILRDVIPKLPAGYTTLVFPDYVGLYGKKDFKLSMEALAHFTQFGSAEYAIRTYLKDDFTTTIKVMERWATNENYHIRRLASEGSRPRLPWSFKLEEVLRNPEVTRKILETLKEDTTKYVQKSVANHLNDLSKNNTAYMLDLIGSWNNQHPATGWIIKHASRTLIKQGEPAALRLFGFENKPNITINRFALTATTVALGNYIQIETEVASNKKSPQKLVIDYAIHYMKASGTHNRKVFKWKELMLDPLATVSLTKKQLLVDYSTRKHYMGKHFIELLVNGKSMNTIEFLLIS